MLDKFNAFVENEKELLKSNGNIIFIEKHIRDQRYSLCLECDKYKHKECVTGWCEICLCSPPVKTWLKGQKCPILKW